MKLSYDDVALLELAAIDAIETIEKWIGANGEGSYYNQTTIEDYEALHERLTKELQVTYKPDREDQWRTCTSCLYRFLPTITSDSLCNDCHRKAYR